MISPGWHPAIRSTKARTAKGDIRPEVYPRSGPRRNPERGMPCDSSTFPVLSTAGSSGSCSRTSRDASYKPARVSGEGCLSLPLISLQLAPCGGYQDFPEPVRQVPRTLAPHGPLCRLTDQGVMLGEEADTHGCGVLARFFYLRSSHARQHTPNGTTKQE